jgi:hypothetical protein
VLPSIVHENPAGAFVSGAAKIKRHKLEMKEAAGLLLAAHFTQEARQALKNSGKPAVI